MKKGIFYIFLIVAGIMSSCEKEEIVDFASKQTSLQTNGVNSKLVYSYANAKFGKTKGEEIKIEPIAQNYDTLAYIVNYGAGWELLSGDNRYAPILAKGEGIYNIENLNPGQKVWLETELEYIKAVKRGDLQINADAIRSNKQFWEKIERPPQNTKAEGDPIEDNKYWELESIIELGDTVITSGHLIPVKWGQWHPWNSCVPYSSLTNERCPVGCVAVAGAQMLYYLHTVLNKPIMFYTSGLCNGYESNYTFTFANMSSSAWDNMALTSEDISSERRHQSAILMGWMGNELQMEYSSSGSAANTEDIQSIYSNLNISSQYESYDKSVVWRSLKRNMPVIVRANATKDYVLGIPFYKDGHAWIIDGYYTVESRYQYYYKWTSKTDNHLYEYGEIKSECVVENTDYILMNWGYDGDGDRSLYYPGGDWRETVNDMTYQYKKKMLHNFQ